MIIEGNGIMIKNGVGLHIFPNGDKYYGDWKNYQMHGEGICILANGDKYYGNYRKGKKHGKGIYIFADGDKFDGNWQNDQMHGKGIFISITGAKYDGDWQNGKKHGKGICIYEDGDKYDGNWQNDQTHGESTYTFANGEEFVGEWYKNQMILLKEEKESFLGLTKLSAVLNYNNAKNTGGFDAIAINWLKKRFDGKQYLETNNIFIKTKESLNGVSYASQLDNLKIASIIKKSLRTPQIILSGTLEHSIAFVLYKDNLLICDKGRPKLENFRVKAVMHFKLSSIKTKKDTLDIIGKTKFQEHDEGIKNIYDKLPKIDNITEQDKIFASFQPVGQRTENCWYSSPQAAVRATMWLLAEEELRASGKVTKAENIKKIVNNIYQETISGKIMSRNALKECISHKKENNESYDILNDSKLFILPLPKDKQTRKIIELVKEVNKELALEEKSELQEKVRKLGQNSDGSKKIEPITQEGKERVHKLLEKRGSRGCENARLIL
jgi:hypothetical protein